MTDRSELLLLFEQAIEVDEGTIEGNRKLDAIPEWDSLSVLGFMAMVDSECGKKIEPKELSACQTVDDVLDLVIKGA